MPKNDPTWPSVQLKCANSLENAKKSLYFSKKQKNHRRGNFLALSFGISYGGGQQHPKHLEQDPQNEPILDKLRREEHFARISGHTAGLSSIPKNKIPDKYFVML